MKFAVVEYSSKSGDIWRAAPDRPNYLEDPQKVIDPTSFGCYVSALEGEHIPLTKFVGQDRLYNKIIKRLSGSWPGGYAIDYFARFDVLMVVHQISDAHEIVRFLKKLKAAYPGKVVVGVPTQPFGLLKAHLDRHPAAKADFIEYMNECTVFLTVVESTRSWYESMTRTPVVYLPQIYPVHYAAEFRQERAAKEKSIFVAGITDRPAIAQGFIVARQLQREFPGYHIRVTSIPGVEMDLEELQNTRYEIVPFQQWREHVPWLARQMLAINTDYTATRGRVQVDCAAVGTPALGGNSDGAADLFPELASTPETSTEELISKGRRLLTDPSFYNTITSTAAARLKKYDYDESAARLMMLVKSYKK
jgi:hypothetical protein